MIAPWAVFSSEKLSAADAETFEAFVVPRYLSWFGELALDLFVSGPAARIAHVGCRTGYPDDRFCAQIEQAEIVGVDDSSAALELARAKAAAFANGVVDYRLVGSLPGDLEQGLFTHALCLHPLLSAAARGELLEAMSALLCPGGQALLALPLRGSFQEITDLFREYALKHDDEEFAKVLETSLAERPSVETLSDQFEDAGLVDVDVEVRQVSLPFESGRAFVDDPISQLMILPEVRSWLHAADLTRPLEYVREAMDKYWSESKFELSINVGAASGRLP